MKKTIGAGVVSVIGLLAFADTIVSYEDDGRTLVVTVTTDGSEVLSSDIAKALNEGSITNFIKRGAGLLTVSHDLSAYLGDIHVEEGVYRFVVNTALGKLDGEDVCGSVYVKRGATLDACNVEDNAWAWWNKRIVFEGDGAPGWGGALTWSADKNLSRMVFSSNLVMSANATINNRTTRYFYMSGGSYPVWLNMNGHTLTCKGNGVVSWGCLNVKNPGHIIVDKIKMVLQNDLTYLNGNADNTLSFTNGAALLFNRTSGGGNDWTLRAEALENLSLADGVLDKPSESYWSGPVVLGDNPLKVGVSQYHFSFHGPISGSGLIVNGRAADACGHLNLHNSGNAFTSGVTAVNAFVHLHANGALPAGGGRLSLSNGGVILEQADVDYQLPPLEVNGSAMIAGVQGTWRESVTKSGDGTLVWKSASGSDLLDVREGTVEILEDRSQIAGLMEGGRTYDKQNALWNNWDPTKITTTNCTLGTEAFYTQYHRFWYDPLELEGGKYDRYIVAYRGYVWNNSQTNETWTFTGACGTHLTVSVNEETVFFYTGPGAGSTYRGSAVLHPGANSIEVREYTSITYCPFVVVPDIPDWNRFAFCVGYDPQGRDSTVYADYRKMLDPGDGSIFTWVNPKDIVNGETTVPGSTRTVTTTVPKFTRMKFAKGTVAKFSFLDYTVEVLEGLPEVKGLSDSLKVTGEWKVDAADIVSGARMTVPGKLVFGNQTKMMLTDLTKVMRGKPETSFTIAVAEGGIDGVPMLGDECAERWKVWVDGDAVKVAYSKPGYVISVR